MQVRPKGASIVSRALLCFSCRLLSLSIPLIGGTSMGDGKYSMTESRNCLEHLFLKAEPHVATQFRYLDTLTQSSKFNFLLSSSNAFQILIINVIFLRPLLQANSVRIGFCLRQNLNLLATAFINWRHYLCRPSFNLIAFKLNWKSSHLLNVSLRPIFKWIRNTS